MLVDLKMKSSLGLICVVLSFVVLSGCATLISKTDYPVSIRSEPSQMEVVITRSDGEAIHRATTPTTVTLSARKGYFRGENYLIELLRDDVVVGSTMLNSRIDGWYFANLVYISPTRALFGLLIIDPITGNMWALKRDVIVTEQSYVGVEENEPTLRIATLQSLPEEDRAHLDKMEQ